MARWSKRRFFPRRFAPLQGEAMPGGAVASGLSLSEQVTALGPLVQYDISRLDTLFADRSATPSTPASVDGVVGTVLDISGNGCHAIAPNDASRAILRQSGSLYYLEFDGVNDGYNFSNDLIGLTNTSFTAAGVTTLDSSPSLLLSAGGVGGVGTPLVLIAQDGSSAGCNSPSVTETRVNGVSIGTQTRAALYAAITTGNPSIMSALGLTTDIISPALSGYSTSFRWDMDLFGVAVLNSSDAQDRLLVDQWLASLAGVSL